MQQVKDEHATEAPPPQSMEGVATSVGGDSSSDSSLNKVQESEGMV